MPKIQLQPLDLSSSISCILPSAYFPRFSFPVPLQFNIQLWYQSTFVSLPSPTQLYVIKTFTKKYSQVVTKSVHQLGPQILHQFSVGKFVPTGCGPTCLNDVKHGHNLWLPIQANWGNARNYSETLLTRITVIEEKDYQRSSYQPYLTTYQDIRHNDCLLRS